MAGWMGWGPPLHFGGIMPGAGKLKFLRFMFNERGVWVMGADQGSKTCILCKGPGIRPICVKALDVHGPPWRGHNTAIEEEVRRSSG